MKMVDGATVTETVYCKLKAGDTQRFYFNEDDPPPFNKPNMPKP